MRRYLILLKRLIITLIFGVPTIIWLLLRDKKTVYYVPYNGLGEYCACLGYLEAFKKLRKIDHITLLTPSYRTEVAAFFPCWDSHLVLKDHIYLSVACFGAIPIGRFISRRFKRIVGVHASQYINKSLLYDNPGIYLDDTLKMILKIPRAERRKAPQVPETDIRSIVDKYDLIQGKTVLFNPFTGGDAVQEIPRRIYEDMVPVLRQKGFAVATITSNGSQIPIKGTQGIVASLAEAWHLARWGGWVIGTRSGFFDFIRLSGCKILCIYTSAFKMRDFFSLLPPDNGGNVREYILEDGKEKELTENIFSDMCELSNTNE